MKFNKVDKKRGLRHKKFRKETLKLTQEELRKELEDHDIEKGQSTISNYDRGHLCAGDVLLFYAKRNLNLHWYYTGLGSMYFDPQKKVKADADKGGHTYNSIKKSIKLKSCSEPLAEYLRTVGDLKQIYTNIILNDTDLSKTEKNELKSQIIESIVKKTAWLREHFNAQKLEKTLT